MGFVFLLLVAWVLDYGHFSMFESLVIWFMAGMVMFALDGSPKGVK